MQHTVIFRTGQKQILAEDDPFNRIDLTESAGWQQTGCNCNSAIKMPQGIIPCQQQIFMSGIVDILRHFADNNASLQKRRRYNKQGNCIKLLQ